ncbi:MAG TPA: translesion error-prone DNA polymerase V autoproteolytic subunit [Candidatus Cloacimonadota bacterium]|nr:translesion error-prone DNA polymerase V autoproteolytic subunit [Candidatus Cloacimonadota bacterium]
MKKIKTDGSIQGIYGFNPETKVLRPLIGTSIPAGFPSPATDYIEGVLDLNVYLIQHKPSTYFVKAAGFSMINAGIFPDDLLVVDKALEATHKKVIIAILNGEFTVKRLHITDEGYWLVPENDEFEPVQIYASDDFQIWGVVTYVIHKL